jgi:hypothetical protein
MENEFCISIILLDVIIHCNEKNTVVVKVVFHFKNRIINMLSNAYS